ncbi:prisilkin-39-like [Thunnus albacares]|uniref:prisilkin-39-like n=1 Tax=Thunnus albacares TaxID=8236 RepID=UPI001CF6194A|nr:prisilkin-39-like [Thunnus albacares]
MMMLWILCLLIGSMTCTPVRKAYRSDNAAPAPSGLIPFSHYSGHWRGGVSSDLGSSSSLPSLPNPSSGKPSELPAPQDGLSSAGPGGYGSHNMAGGNNYYSGYASFRDEHFNSPEVSNYGAAYPASQSSGYDSSAPGGNYYGYGYASSGIGYVGDASTSYAAGDENPEPVFSDVSDLEPVYSFSSRSSYQHGREVYTQTRYTPGEPAVPPVSGPNSKTSNQRSPAKAPTKGGF